MGLTNDLLVLSFNLGVESLDGFVLLGLLRLVLLECPFMLGDLLLAILEVRRQVLHLMAKLFVFLDLLLVKIRLVK